MILPTIRPYVQLAQYRDCARMANYYQCSICPGSSPVSAPRADQKTPLSKATFQTETTHRFVLLGAFLTLAQPCPSLTVPVANDKAVISALLGNLDFKDFRGGSEAPKRALNQGGRIHV